MIGRAYRIWIERWHEAFAEEGFASSLALGFAMFVAAWFTNVFAILFATDHASNKVTDIVLSNISVWDVDGFFVYGTLVFAALSSALILPHPKRLPFALKAVALFWLIRSGFSSLTHIAPYVDSSADFGPSVNRIFFGADTFFSAHTGMPFLGALAFWRYPIIRYVFIAGTVYFGVVVLLGHLHYSIDVAAAFFITYGIFEMATLLFPKDRKRFHYDLNEEGAL